MDPEEEVDYSPEGGDDSQSSVAVVQKTEEGDDPLKQILDYDVEEEFNSVKDETGKGELEEVGKPLNEELKEVESTDPKIEINVEDYFTENVLYKVLGTPKDGTYKEIFIIGDSRVRQLVPLWPTKYQSECPTIISIKNLTFDMLQSTVEEHCQFTTEGKNLIICSLGIHDIIELKEIPLKQGDDDDDSKHNHNPLLLPDLSDPEINVVVSNIVDKMKTFKKEMLEKSVDVVFTDTIPVDLSKMQQFQLKQIQCEICEASALDKETLNKCMDQVKQILNSIHEEIVKEELCKLNNQSSTWLLLADKDEEDFYGEDGINLKPSVYYEIMKKISKLCSYFFARKMHKDFEDDVSRDFVHYERIDVPFLPAVRAYRTYKRVIIVGDYWLEPIIDMWPSDDVLKPTFAVLNKLGVEEIVKKLEIKYDLNNTLLILSVGTSDIFTYVSHDDCRNHRPLKFPAVHNSLLRSPSAFAGKLWARMFSLKNRVQKQYIGTHIVYLTVYPMNLLSYHNHLVTEHQEKYCHRLDPLMDKITLSRVSKNLPIAFQQINMWINENSQTNNLPTWGINKILNVKGSEKTAVFPEVNVKVSVANKVIVKFQSLIEQSNPIDDNAIYEAEVSREQGVDHKTPHERWLENERDNDRRRMQQNREEPRRPERSRTPDIKSRLGRRSDRRDLNKLYKDHENEFQKYKDDPTTHPTYEEEKTAYMDIQYMQQYNVEQEQQKDAEDGWKEFWKTKLDKIFNDEWEKKRRDYIKDVDRERERDRNSRRRERERDERPLLPPPAKRGRRDDYPTPRSSQADLTLATVKILTEIADKLGPMAKPIHLWQSQAHALDQQGFNPTIIFDRDGMLLLGMILDKLKSFLRSGELGVVQNVIVEGAVEKLYILIDVLQANEREFFGIDIHALGHATVGYNNQQLMDYISNVLNSSGYNSHKNFDKFMSAVTTYHESLKVEQNLNTNFGGRGRGREFDGPYRRGGSHRGNYGGNDMGHSGPPSQHSYGSRGRGYGSRFSGPNRGGKGFNSRGNSRQSGFKKDSTVSSILKKQNLSKTDFNKPATASTSDYGGGNNFNQNASGGNNFNQSGSTSNEYNQQGSYSGAISSNDYNQGDASANLYGQDGSGENNGQYGAYNQSGYGNGQYNPGYGAYNANYSQGYGDYSQGGYNYGYEYGGGGEAYPPAPASYEGEFSKFKDSGIPLDVLRKFKNFRLLDSKEKENAKKYMQVVESRDAALAGELKSMMEASYWI